MGKHQIDDGEVEIEIAGETRTLKPTLEAAQRVDRHFGGYSEALRAVEKLHLDSITYIIRQGLGLNSGKAGDLAHKVWRQGLPDLLPPVAEYVTILANGGRRPDPDAYEGEGDDTEKK